MNDESLDSLARELNARGEAYALVTVVRAVAPTSAYLGAQAIILADGTLSGWIGGGCARDVVVSAALGTIRSGEPKLVRISNERVYAEEDVEQYRMSCASNGSVEVFIQPYSVHSALCVLGDTPAAAEARFLAERLRIRLADVAAAPPVVLVATQGQGDEAALEAALRSPARKVLMIASRRKADTLRALMRTRGLSELQLARLEAPAGPSAGAKTPGEIAMVAMVGVLAALRSHDQPAVERPPARSGATPAQFVNPVCGVAVSTEHPKHVEVYAGLSYYFCCDGCRDTFLKDPARYSAIHLGSQRAAPA